MDQMKRNVINLIIAR